MSSSDITTPQLEMLKEAFIRDTSAQNEGEDIDTDERGDTSDDHGSDDESQYTYESDLVSYDPVKEWQGIVNQFNSLVFLVVIPVVGRMIGRRFAHYLWRRVADQIF